MKQFETRIGSRVVITTEQDGTFSSRLYVNGGDTACFQNAEHKTLQGAQRWANKTLAAHGA